MSRESEEMCRYAWEEKLRERIYNIVDDNHLPFRMPEEEYTLWNNAHTALEQLGFYYRKQGYTVWEH